jgi:hypothetical protein
MKFQFSLATLLICMAVLGGVAALCSKILVRDPIYTITTPDPVHKGHYHIDTFYPFAHAPTTQQLAIRFALWGPVALLVTLMVLWIVRWFRPRRIYTQNLD